MKVERHHSHIIVEQLGGDGFVKTTGARNFLSTDNGVQMRLPGEVAKDNVNCVRISVSKKGTYNMEYGVVMRKKIEELGGFLPEYQKVGAMEDLDPGRLKKAFTLATGLKTSEDETPSDSD